MKEHIYSVKAKSEAGNITYNDNTKRPKPKENQLGILGISSKKFSRGSWVQERVLLGLCIYL